MHIYFNIFGHSIPGYGLMIVIGICLANLIAIHLINKYKLNIYHLILLEAYSLLGGGIGAKVLYLFILRNEINWHQLYDIYYLNTLIKGGFVFFGGLISGLLCFILAGHIHHINYKLYLQKFTFLLPFAHAFGRLGCFMAGCCYGFPYNGFGSVIFPSNSLAPPGIPLFPVQLLESLCLFILSLIIWYLSTHFNYSSITVYLFGYSILRFSLEFLRSDLQRGYIGIFSTSQWISLLFISAILTYTLYKRLLYPIIFNRPHNS